MAAETEQGRVPAMTRRTYKGERVDEVWHRQIRRCGEHAAGENELDQVIFMPFAGRGGADGRNA